MSKGGDSIVEVALAQSHRLANILVICKELRGAKANRARLRGCSRRDFEHVRARGRERCQILQLHRFDSGGRGHDAKDRSTRMLYPASAVLRDLEFQRQNGSTAAPDSNHQGRPLGAISNLQTYCSGRVVASELLLPTSRLLFNEAECPQDSSIRCKDRRFSLSREGPSLVNSLVSIEMKSAIHPNYVETVIVCACGATYRTRSTRDNIKIGICAACHPFFTGEQKFVDSAGRVDKFKRRYGTVRATRSLKPG